MSALRHTLTQLAEQFVSNVLRALSTATVSDLASVSGSPASPANAPQRTIGRRPRSSGEQKRGRRSANDIQATVDAIIATLKKAQQGMRSHELQKALNLTQTDLQRPIALALESKAIRKKGERRGTTYFA